MERCADAMLTGLPLAPRHLDANQANQQLELGRAALTGLEAHYAGGVLLCDAHGD